MLGHLASTLSSLKTVLRNHVFGRVVWEPGSEGPGHVKACPHPYSGNLVVRLVLRYCSTLFNDTMTRTRTFDASGMLTCLDALPF